MPANLETLALAAALLAALPAVAADTLPSLLQSASRGGHYQTPAADELRRARALFVQLARGEPPTRLASEAAKLELEVVSLDSSGLVVVREAAEARRGRGFYAFRSGRGARDVLLVPHSFKDEMTREIGLALMSEGRFRAGAWNTVPRHYEHGGKRIDADLAHLDETWFNAFTAALAEVAAGECFLQLHGFDPGKRRHLEAAQAQIILSAGHDRPPESLRQGWLALRQAIPAAALYPETVRELGGTTNAQAKLLQNAGNSRFIHAEMSRDLRERLMQDAALRRRLLDSLTP